MEYSGRATHTNSKITQPPSLLGRGQVAPAVVWPERGAHTQQGSRDTAYSCDETSILLCMSAGIRRCYSATKALSLSLRTLILTGTCL